MNFSDWDNELAVVARELEQVSAAHGRTRGVGNKDLVARKVTIVQTQMRLDRNLDRLKQITSRDLLLLPREKAMLHWATIYLDKMGQLIASRTKLQSRTLWLKLIKARLLGPGTDPNSAVDADDLVALSVRHANLAKTEKYLNDALNKMRVHRKKLVARYEQIGIVDANRTAALTLGTRLGVTPRDALFSPPMRALGALLKTATAAATRPEATAYLSTAQVRTSQRTEGLLSLCRNVVFARLRDPESPTGDRILDKFQAAMQQLDDLEDETRMAYEQIRGHSPTPAHPILVQNSPKQAKTIR